MQEPVWQAWAQHVDDLRRHRFIETFVARDVVPPEILTPHEQLDVVAIHMPFPLDDFFAVFNEAARQVA